MPSSGYPHRRGKDRKANTPTNGEWSLSQSEAVVDAGGDVTLDEQRIERRLVGIIPVTVGRAPKTPQGAFRRPRQTALRFAPITDFRSDSGVHSDSLIA